MPVALQDVQEDTETGAESQDSVETPVDTRDANELLEALIETQDVQEDVETGAESQNSTETPVDIQNTSEHSEAAIETQDNPQKSLVVSSNLDDTPSHPSEADLTGIEHS